MFLEIDNLSKRFGGLQVLREVSFTMEKGEIVGLIGPNGAGKSTLFNLITGVYRPSGGEIRFRDKKLSGLKPHQVCKQGVARTFQLVKVFPSMTVLENVLAGAIYGRSSGQDKALSDAFECLEILNLQHLKDKRTSQITYSDCKLVEIARAIAPNPGLALLDEPLAGLNPAETEKIMGVIQDIRKLRGISIIWIEHKIDAVFNVCDRILVLDYGKKIAEGQPREIAVDKKVVEAYLGEPVT